MDFTFAKAISTRQEFTILKDMHKALLCDEQHPM